MDEMERYLLDTQGYLVVRDVLDQETVKRLLAPAHST